MQRRTLWLVVGIVGGGVLVVLVLGGGFLALLTALTAIGRALTAAETLPVAGVIALGLGLGVPLMLHGWAGWRARPSRPFNPSRVWPLWLLFVVLLVFGTAVSVLPLAPAVLLPPVHVVTMALLPLIVLWMVGRALRGRGGSWREVIVSLGGGGLFGLGASIVGEGLLIFALAVVATLVLLLMPGGQGRIVVLSEALQDPAWQADPANALALLLSPVVAITVLVVFSIPVPLIEEAFKTLVVGAVGRWVRPHPARAFLWGVASGAGFALIENVFNGALGGAESWTVGALARFGATLMHCVTGGIVGWGWGQLWTEKRHLRLLGSYAVATITHGLWNGVSVAVILLGAVALVHGMEGPWIGLAGLGVLGLAGGLAVAAAVFVGALLLAGRRLADETERAGDGADDPGWLRGPAPDEVASP